MNEQPQQLDNPFEPENYEVSSALGGVRGVIQAEPVPEFIKWNYPNAKETDKDFTVLHFVVAADKLEQPRPFHIRVGAAEPAVLNGAKLEQAIVGPFLLGKLSKSSNASDFFTNLKAAGFDLGLLAISKGKGVHALAGADITWKAFEKKIGGGKGKTSSIKAYDVPSEFHGFVGVGASPEPDQTALRAAVANIVAEGVKQFKELPRGQLQIKLGAKLAALPQGTQALALLLKDEFLATIPGTTYDGKILKAAKE